MLRVHFGDNDFCSVIQNACNEFMHQITKGYERHEAEVQFKNAVKEYGMDKIKRSIVLSSYGFYIVTKANRLFANINYDFEDQTHTIKYLDERISIEEVSTFNDQDDNYETCYIDFYNLKVYTV